ncbi:MAG: DUF2069 domain-containing protein [Pseudohongiella sp.]|nr:DUF2069 domain-containing protein [Pseudohongiella sp.]
MTHSTAVLPANIQRTKTAILLTYYALIAYFAVSATIIFDEIRLASLVIWLLQTIPLLLFALGLHRAQLRTYAWLCFVVLLYFMHAVMVAFQAERLWLGLIEVTLCTALFVLLIVFIRQYRVHYQVPL